MRAGAAAVIAAAVALSSVAAAQEAPRLVIRSAQAAPIPADRAAPEAVSEPAPRPRRAAPRARPVQAPVVSATADPVPVFEFDSTAAGSFVTRGALDFRASPSETAAVVGVAEGGVHIKIIGRVLGTDGWHAVERGGRIAFVRMATPEPAQPPTRSSAQRDMRQPATARQASEPSVPAEAAQDSVLPLPPPAPPEEASEPPSQAAPTFPPAAASMQPSVPVSMPTPIEVVSTPPSQAETTPPSEAMPTVATAPLPPPVATPPTGDEVCPVVLGS